MRACLLVFAFAFLMPLASQGQDKIDNPFKNAKVGDYLAYKMTTTAKGKEFEMTVKQTVTEVNDKEVTLKTTSNFMGLELPGQTNKIDLTKPYDIAAMATQGNAKGGKFEKTGEGKEKIKVGEKTYDCSWISGKVTADVKGKQIESDIKVWQSKTVPLSGAVKMEAKSKLGDVKMELTEVGTAKKP